jgi:hypothetical protein
MDYIGNKAQGFSLTWFDPLHMLLEHLRFPFTVSPYTQNTFL